MGEVVSENQCIHTAWVWNNFGVFDFGPMSACDMDT